MVIGASREISSRDIFALLPPVNGVSLADRRPNAFKPPSRMTFLTVDVGAVSDKSNHRLMVGGLPSTFELYGCGACSNRIVLKQFAGRESCTDAAQIHAGPRRIRCGLPNGALSARDESRLVRCAVTGRALAAAAIAYSLEETDPLLVYRTFKARIRAAAHEKYRKHLVEEDGLVIVRRRDLCAV
jgi:hypothetical protein